MLVIGILLFAAIVALFSFITNEIVLQHETGFDEGVFKLLVSFNNPLLLKVMLIFTFFGSTGFLLPAYLCIVCYYLFYRKMRAGSLNIALVGVTSVSLIFFLKNIFKRNRPIHPLVREVAGYSYPSGHSFSAFTFWGLLIFLVWSSKLRNTTKIVLTVLFFIFASMIATSRVYLHVHYASDVIGGFCLSIIWLSICYLVLVKVDLPKRLVRRFR